jgi:hypothetical protein
MLRREKSRSRATRVLFVIGITVLAVPQLAMAVITFDQLDDDLFVVSHRVKVKFWMSRGQAVRKVYEKAASLCVAAGYTHFEILQQESEANQRDDDANASIRVRFSTEGGDERIECQRSASDRYVEQATGKLARRGYRPPPPAGGSSAATQADAGTQPW